MYLKCTWEICVITMKNDAKIDKELTCQFKIDMRNSRIFDLNTQSL